MHNLINFGSIFKQVHIALKDQQNNEKWNQAIEILKLLYVFSEDSEMQFV